MERRPFGSTGLRIAPVALGAASLGELDEQAAFRLLDRARELGVELVDTARSYVGSEEAIARYLARHPGAFRVSTKIGYGVPGYADWTGPGIAAGVDAALARLGLETIDLVHLHSCAVNVLEKDDILEALDRALEAGKLRVAAYSGDNDALAWAVNCGRFASVQASYSLCDRANHRALEQARARGFGTIAKRALANAPWRSERPTDPAAAQNWDRWRALGYALDEPEASELLFRFVAHHAPVDLCLVGTRSPENLAWAVQALESGPLPPDTVTAIDHAYHASRADWPAII